MTNSKIKTAKPMPGLRQWLEDHPAIKIRVIEDAANIPKHSLQKYMKGVRGIPKHHLPKLLEVLKNYGFNEK